MGKKKHNYVNIPSVSETDEVMNDNLLSDGVKRDLIILHRVNKNIKSYTMKAIDVIKEFISDKELSLDSNDKISHIEINTFKDDSDNMKSRLLEFFDSGYNDEKIKNSTVDNITLITSTIEFPNCSIIVSKFGVVNYSKNNSKIKDVMYINESFIVY